MEDRIMLLFERQNSKAGHILMIRNINHGLMQNLNPKEKLLVEPAINNLIDKGYITYENANSGPECLRLTEMGFQSLYPNSRDMHDIETLVLNLFEKQESKPGDILMMKNLNFNIYQNLNPKEQALYTDALNNLINNGYVTYEDASSGIECIRLTEEGFEKLYQ